jgi:hypothetical protein
MYGKAAQRTLLQKQICLETASSATRDIKVSEIDDDITEKESLHVPYSDEFPNNKCLATFKSYP